VTPRRISELRALFEKATPAPWKQDKHCSIWAGPSTIDDPGYFVASAAYGIDREEADNRKNDSAFIAASRTALPEALDEIERLREALEDARHEVSLSYSYIDSDRDGKAMKLLGDLYRRLDAALGAK
jgi:hypothetical protein